MSSVRGFIDRLFEARPVFTSEIAKKLGSIEGLSIVDSWFDANGTTTLVRDADGQAYEIAVRPASLGNFAPFQRHYGTGNSRRRTSFVPTPERPNLP